MLCLESNIVSNNADTFWIQVLLELLSVNILTTIVFNRKFPKTLRNISLLPCGQVKRVEMEMRLHKTPEYS